MKQYSLNQFFLIIIAISIITLVPTYSLEIFAEKEVIEEKTREKIIAQEREIDEDIQNMPDIVLNGEAQGWAIFNDQAHKAHLKLDGKGVIKEENKWKIKSDSIISIGEKNAIVGLKGKVIENKLRLNGSGELNDGSQFRIILRGHFAPIDDTNENFALVFKTAIISTTTDERIKIPMVLIGQVNAKPIEPLFIEESSDNIDPIIFDLE